eukprot:GHVP01004203.1.p1 GENE.GHVP01004203.1~~GHVP01004203.1.p1  ORF type:complete len:108 (+),score=13.95 GHVP01004203.1:33-356(+)
MSMMFGEFLNYVLPLTTLLKKNVPFTWAETQQKACEVVKKSLEESSAWSLLSSDASESGLGAYIHQVNEEGVEEFMQFDSRTLSAAEKNYSCWEREALAVVFAMKKF